MNNYWCQKHTSTSNPWKGTPRSDGSNGHQDIDGHAIFKAVDWSVRAMAMDLKSKYTNGNKSANKIAAMHSPWCDTLGSKAIVEGHGRTCDDGRAKPPSGFSGPFCKEPSSKEPKRSDCKDGCNCPPEIAELLIKGLDPKVSVNDDLQLFDYSSHKPLPNLVVVLKNLAFQEQGIIVSDAAIARGIKLLSK